MAETLTANTGNLGFTVLSSSVDIYYDDGVYNNGETPVAEDNLGLIIGASVGGVVLIAIIVLVIYKCKNKGK